MTENGDFPDWLFPAPPTLSQEYLARVARGYDRVRNKSVVIGGLARNLGGVFPLTKTRIERLGSIFRDYEVVIYENDSSDETLQHLRDWELANPRVTVLTETLHDSVHRQCRSLSRARRMAYYRSKCHEQIMRGSRDRDFVILVDTDLLGGWSYDGVANSFGHDNWDFMGAYGVIFRRKLLSPNHLAHYDAWAYRNDENFTPLSTAKVNGILFERGEPLHPVTSCFGGLGIYRMQAFLAGAYDGSDIEHVTFHRRLHEMGFGRMFLNPSQIALYGRRHRSLDPWADRVLKLMKHMPGQRQQRWFFSKQESLPSTPSTRQTIAERKAA